MEDRRYIAFPSQLSVINGKTSEVQFSMASEPLVGTLLRTLAASKLMDANSLLTSVDNDGAVQRIAAESLGIDQRLTLASGVVVAVRRPRVKVRS